MTEDGNKLGWTNSFIKHEIKFGIDSILDTAATPQRLIQLGVKDYRSGKHDICTLCKKEKGTLGHILGHCDVALGKTESSFNRIAWRHDKVLQTTREKALEHSKLIKTKGYQLMADLGTTSYRHCEVSIQRSNPTSFSSTNPPKTSLSGELTCPMEARMTYWHETKTKKYHDKANRIAEKGFTVRFFAFEVGCRGLVGESLRKFLTALELPKKIIEETLTDCAITALKCSRKIFLSRSSFNFEPSC